jgi:hypothetical protein
MIDHDSCCPCWLCLGSQAANRKTYCQHRWMPAVIARPDQKKRYFMVCEHCREPAIELDHELGRHMFFTARSMRQQNIQ